MKKLLTFSAIALGAASLASGQILVSYYFDAVENSPPAAAPGIAGGVGSLTVPSHTALTAAGLSASSAIDMSNIVFSGFGGTLFTGNGHPWAEAGELDAVYRTSGNDGGNLEGSAAGPTQDPNGFLSFTVTNNSTDAFAITDFNFAIGWNRGNNTRIHYYAEVLIEGTSVWNSGSVEVGPMRLPRTSVDHGYDLSTLSLSIAEAETAEFRLYTVHQGGSSQFLYVANMEAVVIPEPSTYAALFGLLAIGFVAWRRRSRA